MKLHNLIKTNNWLSVELMFISLYPGQKTAIESYKDIYDHLRSSQATESDISIVLTKCSSDKPGHFYIDVSGRKEINTQDLTNSLAIEFVPWKEWLGMTIDQETNQLFTELEIIGHCLYEMTFAGYDETEIQNQFASLKDQEQEYKNMTDEEKSKNTKTIDELFKDIKKKKRGNESKPDRNR